MFIHLFLSLVHRNVSVRLDVWTIYGNFAPANNTLDDGNDSAENAVHLEINNNVYIYFRISRPAASPGISIIITIRLLSQTKLKIKNSFYVELFIVSSLW